MVYFVVVTLSTVGYGDIEPISKLGQFCVLILIILATSLIPKQTSELVTLANMQSIYARAVYKSNNDIPFLLICGDLSVSVVNNFCQELFHPDHGMQDTNAVIIQKHSPPTDMELFLHTPTFQQQLKYLQGNPLDEKTLKRASAVKAQATVVLTQKNVVDPISSDHRNILTGISVKKYVYNNANGRNVRLCLQLIKPESKKHYFSG